MMSFVATRKRKDGHHTRAASLEKGKVRRVEKSRDGSRESRPKPARLRSSLPSPSTRALSGIRRGSVKIFSVFRTGKGM
jgi:hypothetical protein